MSSRSDLLGDPLPVGAIMRAGTVRFRVGAPNSPVIFSPNGKLLLSSAGGGIKVWQAQTGKLVRQFDGAGTLRFSLDGKQLGLAGPIPRRWDLIRGVEIPTANPGGQSFLSPDLKLIASLNNPELAFVDADKGNPLPQFKDIEFAEREKVFRVYFSSDGQLVAASIVNHADRRNFMRVWNTATGKLVLDKRILGADPFQVPIAFSPDAKQIATYYRNAVRIIDLVTGAEVTSLPRTKTTKALAYSCDGLLVTAGYERGVVSIWDVTQRRRIRALQGHEAYITSVCFSPDGKRLAVSDFAGIVWLWDVASGQRINWDQQPHGEIRSVAIAPEGKELYTVSKDRTVRKWDISTGIEDAMHQHGGSTHEQWYSNLTFSPDGQSLAVTGGNVVRLLRATGLMGGKFGEMKHEGEAYFDWSLYHPDGDRFFGLDHYGRGAVWKIDASSQKYSYKATAPTTTWKAPGWGPVSETAAFSPDGRYFVISRGRSEDDWDNCVWVCDANTGKPIAEVEMQKDEVFGRTTIRGVAFLPNSKTLLWCDNQTVHFFDVETKKEKANLSMPEPFSNRGQMTRLACSRDGRYLAVVTADWKINVFEIASGRRVFELAGHAGRITSLAFSRDGRLLTSGSADTSALVWDMTVAAREKRNDRGARARRGSPDPAETAESGDHATASAVALHQLWTDLASDSMLTAFDAQWQLVEAGDSAAELISKELQLPSTPDEKTIANLIKQLDSDEFKVRGAATEKLRNFAPLIPDRIRKAAQTATSTEVQGRLQSIIAELDAPFLTTPDALSRLRGIFVLELINSTTARQKLRSLAGGPPSARETVAATEALARLNHDRPILESLARERAKVESMFGDVALNHSFHGPSLGSILKTLGNAGGYEVSFDPKVDETITLNVNFQGVTFIQALKNLLPFLGLAHEVDGENVKIIPLGPAESRRRSEAKAARTKLTDDTLADYLKKEDPKNIDLSGAQITDAGVEHLATFGEIEVLDLSDTNVTDESLKHLEILKNLRVLNISGSGFTDIGRMVRKRKLQTLLLQIRE